MFKHEKHQNTPEQRLDDTLARYHEQLNQAVNVHDNSAHMISVTQANAITILDELESPNLKTFKHILDDSSGGITKATTETTKTVDQIISDFHGLFVSLLPNTDKQLWEEVQAYAKRYGVSPTGSKLSHASSRLVGSIMNSLLQNNPQTSGSPRSGRSESGRGRSESDGFRTPFDDMFAGAGGEYRETGQQGSSSGQQPPPQQEQPRTTPRPPRQPSKLDEAREIIRRAIAVDSSFSWLGRKDPNEVLRVINSVKAIRKNSAEKGETISDREIYLRYRRKVEVGEANDSTQESLTILTALMGGKPNGKLPF